MIGDVLHSYYGTTETGINTIATPEDMKRQRRTAGYAIEGSSIEIVDSTGLPVSRGETGRVAVRSYMNADTYEDGDIPSTYIRGARYVITADTGRVDPDTDELLLLGRRNNAIDRTDIVDIIGLEEEIKKLQFIDDAVGVFKDDAIHIYVSVHSKGDVNIVLTDKVLSTIASSVFKFAKNGAFIYYVKEVKYNLTGKFDSSSTASTDNVIKFQEVR